MSFPSFNFRLLLPILAIALMCMSCEEECHIPEPVLTCSEINDICPDELPGVWVLTHIGGYHPTSYIRFRFESNGLFEVCDFGGGSTPCESSTWAWNSSQTGIFLELDDDPHLFELEGVQKDAIWGELVRISDNERTRVRFTEL